MVETREVAEAMEEEISQKSENCTARKAFACCPNFEKGCYFECSCAEDFVCCEACEKLGSDACLKDY